MAQTMEDAIKGKTAVDRKEIKPALNHDATVTCPGCGHDEAIVGEEAPGGGFYEICCECKIVFVDPTP